MRGGIPSAAICALLLCRVGLALGSRLAGGLQSHRPVAAIASSLCDSFTLYGAFGNALGRQLARHTERLDFDYFETWAAQRCCDMLGLCKLLL